MKLVFNAIYLVTFLILSPTISNANSCVEACGKHFSGTDDPQRYGQCIVACKSDPDLLKELQRSHGAPSNQQTQGEQQNEQSGEDEFIVSERPGQRKNSGSGSGTREENQVGANPAGPQKQCVDYEGDCIALSEICATCKIDGGNCARYNCPVDGGSADSNQQAASSNGTSVNACAEARDAVLRDCNSENQGWIGELNQMAQTIGPAFKPGQSTCGTLASVDTATKASLATFSISCNSSFKTCQEQCKVDPTAAAVPGLAAEMQANLKTCNDMGVRGKQAEQRAVQATQALTSAVQQCAQNMGGLNDVAMAHCLKPENMNTESCKINLGQGLAVQGPGIQQPPPGLNHGGVGSTTGQTGTTSGDGFDLGNLSTEDEGAVTPHAAKQGEEIGGAKGGGRLAGGDGGGSGGAGGSGGGKGGLSGLVSNILSGFFGGGGGSGGGGSGRGGGWKSFFGGNGGANSQQAQNNKVPDLRQFMPGGMKDPNKHRGIAGQFIGRDGISGPHADLWKLVNNRYQYKRATLLP